MRPFSCDRQCEKHTYMMMMVVIFDPIKATIIVVFWCCFIFSPSSEGFIFFRFCCQKTVFESYSKCVFWIFLANFCPINTDFSRITVWPQASCFPKFAKTNQFLVFAVFFFNVARFARNVEWDLILWFSTPCPGENMWLKKFWGKYDHRQGKYENAPVFQWMWQKNMICS